MAVMLAAQAIRYGEAEVIVAGGMENMSLAPHFLRGYRTGQRLGDGKLIDCIVHDGLWCPFGDVHMGEIAEATAKAMGIARPEQDAFAAESYKRAQAAIDLGYFRDEIVPVTIPQKKGEPVVVVTDEEPGKGKIEKFPTLPPAFVKDGTGTITAANASSINDGAAAVVIMSAEKAEELGLFRSPKIVEWASFSMKPEEFPVAPNEAVRALLNKTVLNLDDVDAWEINEAFSVVSLANNRLLGLDGEKVNIRGGAVALGHPIGASGARILVTLLYIMKANDYQKGVAALCNGGGEATAMLIGR
jgi:acetyl-CoA C-acetyltransferase